MKKIISRKKIFGFLIKLRENSFIVDNFI